MFLYQIIQSAFASLHDRCDNGNIGKGGPRKRLGLLVFALVVICTIRTGTGFDIIDIVFFRYILLHLRRLRRRDIIRLNGSIFVGITHVIDIHIFNFAKVNVLCRLESNPCATCVTKLGIVTCCPKFQFECLADLVSKPTLLRELFIVIRNVNGMRTCNPNIDTIHLRKMLASRLRQGNRCNSSNVSCRMRALHSLLEIICNVRTLGNPKCTIVSAHRLERRQDHRGLAMNRNGCSPNLNVIGIYDRINRTRQLYAIFIDIG